MPNCQCPECRGANPPDRITGRDALGLLATIVVVFVALTVIL